VSRTVLLLAGLALSLALSGCGGGKPSPAPTSTTTSSPAPAPVPMPSGGATPINPPAFVTVAAGQPVGGININVSPPALSPQPNAEVLGVSAIGTGGSASNVGATISRGTTMKVLLFGAGLSGSMTVTIDGPQDISVSNITSITSTDKTPGVAFDAVVGSAAALGARTVILTDSSGDITTFTGGLEVVQ